MATSGATHRAALNRVEEARFRTCHQQRDLHYTFLSSGPTLCLAPRDRREVEEHALFP